MDSRIRGNDKVGGGGMGPSQAGAWEGERIVKAGGKFLKITHPMNEFIG